MASISNSQDSILQEPATSDSTDELQHHEPNGGEHTRMQSAIRFCLKVRDDLVCDGEWQLTLIKDTVPAAMCAEVD